MRIDQSQDFFSIKTGLKKKGGVMNKQIICTFIAVFIFGTASFGSEFSIRSVDNAIQLGLQYNPEFQAQLNILKSKEMLPEKLGSLSDPNMGVRLNGTPAKNSDYSFDQKRYFVNQSFPFFGEPGRKKRLGEKELDLAIIDVELTRNNVSLMIQKVYFGLVLNQELTEITKKNNQILENIINIADIKYQSGKTLQAHVLNPSSPSQARESKIRHYKFKRPVIF
ncbi:MAG: TolC family protein [bacterium]|nr:TolC family protein [bacterium]